MYKSVAFNKHVFPYRINNLDMMLDKSRFDNNINIEMLMTDSDHYKLVLVDKTCIPISNGITHYYYGMYHYPLERSNYLNEIDKTRYLSRDEWYALISAYIGKYNKYKVIVKLHLNKISLGLPLGCVLSKSTKQEWFIYFCYILMKIKYNARIAYNLKECSISKMSLLCTSRL